MITPLKASTFGAVCAASNVAQGLSQAGGGSLHTVAPAAHDQSPPRQVSQAMGEPSPPRRGQARTAGLVKPTRVSSKLRRMTSGDREARLASGLLAARPLIGLGNCRKGSQHEALHIV